MASLIDLTDAHMTRRRLAVPRSRSLYPSESSVSYKDDQGVDRVLGACLRAVYWRITGTGERRAESKPSQEWIFELGKSVERVLIEQWKQMGIWVDSNVKFYDALHDISGEVDAVLEDDRGKYLVEVKSFYGHYATKEICGNTFRRGAPKDEHLMQVMIYLDFFSRAKICDRAKIVYYARDSSKRAEFNVRLAARDGYTYAEVDGVVDKRFTLEGIHERYAQLRTAVETSQVPDRDYVLEYDDATVERMARAGEISKTALEAHRSGKKRAGDWRCGYCPYVYACWKKEPPTETEAA